MKRILSVLFTIVFSSLCAAYANCKKRPELQEQEDLAQLQMDELTQKGKELYMQSACHSCHGTEGYGDGPAGVNLNPPPRNYKELTNYQQGSSLEDITNTLLTGVPGTTMAPYPHLSEEKRRAIASYVVYLQKQKKK